jgi:hypothetical protein
MDLRQFSGMRSIAEMVPLRSARTYPSDSAASQRMGISSPAAHSQANKAALKASRCHNRLWLVDVS